MKRKEVGDTKSIGVCNFHAEHLSNIIDLSFFTPAINQIELHPLLNQAELREINAGYGIVTEAYSPLGVGRLLDHETVTSVAQSHGKTPAQVLIRWSLQLGNVVVPARRHRSGSPRTSRCSTSNSPTIRWPRSTASTRAPGSARTRKPTPAPSFSCASRREVPRKRLE